MTEGTTWHKLFLEFEEISSFVLWAFPPEAYKHPKRNMTTKKKLTNKDYTKMLSNYDLGEFKVSKIFTQGKIQTNVLLTTSKGKYVLRYYNSRSKQSVAFEVHLINYLKQRKFPCPCPRKNKQAQFIGTHNSKPYVIFEFIEGAHKNNPNKNQKKQLVQKIAELQNILNNYKPINKKYRQNYSINTCKKLAQEQARKINTPNTKEKLKWLKKELSKLNLPKSLPKGICHCDFHFTNILFKNGKFNALIDFDDANYTYRVFDLAILIDPFIFSFSLNTWKKYKINKNVLSFKEVKIIVSTYMKYRPLNIAEKKYLFDVHKLSILLDCTWYFARGNAKDFFEKRKIDYLNNLGREKFYNKIFSTKK